MKVQATFAPVINGLDAENRSHPSTDSVSSNWTLARRCYVNAACNSTRNWQTKSCAAELAFSVGQPQQINEQECLWFKRIPELHTLIGADQNATI